MDARWILMVLTCLACASHGWRAQKSAERLWNSKVVERSQPQKLGKAITRLQIPPHVNRSRSCGHTRVIRHSLKSVSQLLLIPRSTAAFKLPTAGVHCRPGKQSLTSSRPAATRREALAAAACTFLAVRRAEAADRSLTDSEGRFVVDTRKAAAGLEDPVVESDGAYSTISAALAVAPSGATIIVRSGTYNERLKITRPIRLLADADAVVTWKTDKPYESVVTVALEDVAVKSGSVGEVLVSGLTVRHYSKSIAQNYAVYVPEPSAVVDKARIEFTACDITSTSGSGVGIEGGDVTLSKCQISNCKNQGILYAGPKARGSVVGCTVEKCTLNGILVTDRASPTLRANVFRKNGQYGASLFECRGKVLDDNDARGNGKGGVDGECDIDA